MSTVTTQPGIEGTRFGKYTLVDRLAVGGMAEIFLATQAGLEGFQKTVVIKRIRSHLSKQGSFIRMFLNEAKLAAQLNHPNIVQIHDLGKIGDSYYIAMEYIIGRDMRRILPKAESMGIPFPMVYALKIASSVCEGLYYAHQRADAFGNPLYIVHRDVTPENIFVSFDGTVKMLDFGIAKAAGQLEQTKAGEIKGKASYMSPEQCLGKPLDCSSDLFSLGIVLYEWLTGFKLFTADAEVAILRSIVDGTIYPPSYFRADIPQQVEAILMRALQKDREQRYQSAWEMQYDIDRFLGEYEFSPSNIHLSNFLKQLFFDELEEEKARLTAALRAEEGEGPKSGGHEAAATQLQTQTGPMLEHATASDVRGADRVLGVPLTEADFQTLEKVAKRNGLSVGKLARDVLSAWLKYK